MLFGPLLASPSILREYRSTLHIVKMKTWFICVILLILHMTGIVCLCKARRFLEDGAFTAAE